MRRSSCRLRGLLWLMLAGLIMLSFALGGCGGGAGSSIDRAPDKPRVVVDTTFLADITRNVAGSTFEVVPVVPEGVDPHAFEPTPRDAATIAEADVLVLTYVGLEPALSDLFHAAAQRGTPLINASADIPGAQEDPHLWLDPLSVAGYVGNIQQGLARVVPGAQAELEKNARAYVRRLEELDSWIREQVATIPEAKRLLVTEHESLGRFAARYGFTVVGTLLPGQSTEGAPSAERLASLVAAIKSSGAKVVFLETGSPGDLADQVARETGVKVVTDLCTHSLSEEAPSYIEMMEWNVKRILEALE